MLIHDFHAGAVIGHGGEKIKELRKQTNSYLYVFPDFCPNSSDRLLRIACDQQERMSETVKAIIAYLKEVVFVLKLDCLRIEHYYCFMIIPVGKRWRRKFAISGKFATPSPTPVSTPQNRV